MKRTKGFLLAEAMFSLFVTILVIMILQNLLFSIKTINHQQRSNDLAYAYVQLNRFLHDDETVSIEPAKSNHNHAVFCKLTKERGKIKKKEYVLEHYDSMLRMTTLSAGHMPLLLQVKEANFATRKDQIEIILREKDGRFSHLAFHLDKDKKDEKS